ncbi:MULTISPECIES: hypothetical protein [unclassified Bradyrhizobium]|uniref:hypothetical protein n=1 Tax=unclassified Bradyrhizobium TaxID=2631580 RepID=UPI00339A985F
MLDEQLARVRTHRNNIQRYRHLLQTSLTDFERQFVDKRLSEEKSKLERLTSSFSNEANRDRSPGPDSRLT